MDLIYSMLRKPMKYETPYIESLSGTSTLCAVSQENIIAFTSLTELDDSSGESWGCHTYVVDMNAPWNKYKVCSTIRQVTVLEWDNDGKYLMVCTSDGEVAIHTTKQWLLSEWYCAYKGVFNGEHVMKGCFFHTGRRIAPCPDKKLDLPCTERYTHVKMAPTLKGFGGVPLEGGCVLTISGLIGVFQIDSLTSGQTSEYRALPLMIRTDSLCPTRQYVRTADIAFGKSGQMVLSWWSAGRVRCAAVRVSLRASGSATEMPDIQLQPVASFFLNQEQVDPSVDVKSVIIRWKNREEPDSLLVAHDQTLELWTLRETSVPLHPLFAKGFPIPGNTTPGGGQKPIVECVNTVIYRWSGGLVRSLATSPSHIVIATSEGVAHLLQVDTLQVLNTTNINTKQQVDNQNMDSTPSKQMKYDTTNIPDCKELCGCITTLGGAAVFLDSHSHLYLYALPHPAADLASPTWAQTACGLLEYSIITGVDCLDVLLALPTNAVDTLYERLTDWFPRQPLAFQQYYHSSWLCLCAAISRLCPNGLSRSVDIMVQVMLHTILNAFKALHRPTDGILTIEKTENVTDDIEPEKVTIDMSVEPVHSVRLAVQRIVDAGLRALARDSFTNASVLRDAISMCRSFLGGRGGATAETLAAIYRLITRDHSNCEEVLALLSQTGLTKGADDPPAYGIAIYHPTYKRPYLLEYDVEPEFLKTPTEQIVLENVNVTDTPMDTIRYWYVGGRGSRQSCARCGARGVRDARHKTHCRCGGRWSVQAVA